MNFRAHGVFQDNLLAVFPPPSHNRLWIAFASTQREEEKSGIISKSSSTLATSMPPDAKIRGRRSRRSINYLLFFKANSRLMPLDGKKKLNSIKSLKKAKRN
jgi:hypothetical protein